MSDVRATLRFDLAGAGYPLRTARGQILAPEAGAARGDDRASPGSRDELRCGTALRAGVSASRSSVCKHSRRILLFDLRCVLRPSVPSPRGLGTLLRLVDEGRPPLHPLRLLRDLPLPAELGRPNPALEAAGKAYYDYRAALMVRNDEGLTKTYNRFHDPTSTTRRSSSSASSTPRWIAPSCDAYGWDDIPTDLRVPARLRDRRGGVGQQEEAVPLPLARRGPRRGARAAARAQRRAGGGGAALAAPRAAKKRAGKRAGSEARARSSWTRPALMTASDSRRARQARSRCASGSSRRSSSTSSGPWPGHELAEERLPGWVRPSNWYLTGFLIPVDAPAERAPMPTPTTTLDAVPESEGLPRRARTRSARPPRRASSPRRSG